MSYNPPHMYSNMTRSFDLVGNELMNTFRITGIVKLCLFGAYTYTVHYVYDFHNSLSARFA